MPYEVDDEWYTRGGAHHYGANYGHRLSPLDNSWTSHGLHRSRSQGHGPAPNIHIYNRADPRMENRSSLSPSPTRSASRGRAPAVEGLEDEMYRLRKELRSRSRGRSDAGMWRDPSPGRGQDWQLWAAQERLKDTEARARLERREEELKRELKLQHANDELERLEKEKELELLRDKALADREKADALAKKREADAIAAYHEKQRKEEEREKALLAELREKERKKADEAKEAQRRAVEEWQRKEREAKEEKEKLKTQLKIEEEREKEKAKKEYEEFKLKQKMEEEKKKEEKKKQEKELEDMMHKKLARFGFQDNQIEAMLDEKKKGKLHAGQSPGNALVTAVTHQHQPTFIKVHRDHLSIDTLRYYNLPWEYDTSDSDYIIILREMDQRETDVLFEHTKRLRKGTPQLFIEERGRARPDYAFVRKRGTSRSRSRARHHDEPVRLRLF